MYREKAEAVYEAIPKSSNGLYSTHYSRSTGRRSSSHYTFGALADSFYEYLLKMWIQVINVSTNPWKFCTNQSFNIERLAKPNQNGAKCMTMLFREWQTYYSRWAIICAWILKNCLGKILSECIPTRSLLFDLIWYALLFCIFSRLADLLSAINTIKSFIRCWKQGWYRTCTQIFALVPSFDRLVIASSFPRFIVWSIWHVSQPGCLRLVRSTTLIMIFKTLKFDVPIIYVGAATDPDGQDSVRAQRDLKNAKAIG